MSTIISNTFTKFAANARWLIEQSGSDPEVAQIIIVSKDAKGHQQLCETIKKFVDNSGDVIFRDDRGLPTVFKMHGVHVACVRQIAP